MIFSNIGKIVSYNPSLGKVEFSDDSQIFFQNGNIAEHAEGELFDCGGGLVTPGFVDPHTHPVYVDAREDEIAQRLAGASYEEIAADGGGINSSIRAVRDADKDDLVERVSKRMDRFLSLGTTTVEAKSGYGLNTDSELKSLQVIDEVNKFHEIDIIPTFLGAHAVPPEFKNDTDAYVNLLCDEMIPIVSRKGVAIFCDVFCENGYFDSDQSRRILTVAREHGMKLRMHADEFEDSDAAELAGELQAVSADHLMAVSESGIKALKDNNVVILSLAVEEMHLTIEEAFAAATYHAAQSLGIEYRVGSIEIGKQADLIVWDVESLEEIPSREDTLPIRAVFKRGKRFEVSA